MPSIMVNPGFRQRVLQVFDLCMEVPCVYRGLDEEILRVSEVLPEFGDLDRRGQDEAALCVVHPDR